MTKDQILKCNDGRQYDGWICIDCGYKWQKDEGGIFSVSTYHRGICGACNKEKPVTEGRDFGYPLIPTSELGE